MKSFYSCLLRFWKITVLVILTIPVIILTAVSQPYFKQYKPTNQGHTNAGHCIIKADTSDADSFVVVGYYNDLFGSTGGGNNGLYSGLVHWLNPPGLLMDWRNILYGTTDARHHWLNFIDSNVVSGEYDNGGGTTTPYKGYAATGWADTSLKIMDNPVVHATWTTIIDPVSHNEKWNYYIQDPIEPRENTGVCVVYDRENTHDFAVLSEIINLDTDNPQKRFAVTKYHWAAGLDGHQEVWSYEYSLDTNFLEPVGIVQGADNDFVVAGNITHPDGNGNLADRRIFTIKIDNNNGNISSPLHVYTNNLNGPINANSITGPYDGNDFVIAGWVINYSGDSFQTPLLMSIDQNLSSNPTTNRSMTYSCGRNAVFNCGKKFDQSDPPNPPNLPTRSTRLVGVGWIDRDDTSEFNTDAFILNASRLDGVGANRRGAVRWATEQGTGFGDELYSTQAKWVVPSPANSFGGQYIYTGFHGGSTGMQSYSVIGGGVNKVSGTSDGHCSEPVSVDTGYIEFDTTNYDAEKEEFGIHISWNTDREKPGMDTASCSGQSSGKVVVMNGNNHSLRSTIQEEAKIQVTDENINIIYSSNQAASVKIILVDLLGNTIMNDWLRCSTGLNSYRISTKGWVSGPYFVTVLSPTYQYNKSMMIVK